MWLTALWLRLLAVPARAFWRQRTRTARVTAAIHTTRSKAGADDPGQCTRGEGHGVVTGSAAARQQQSVILSFSCHCAGSHQGRVLRQERTPSASLGSPLPAFRSASSCSFRLRVHVGGSWGRTHISITYTYQGGTHTRANGVSIAIGYTYTLQLKVIVEAWVMVSVVIGQSYFAATGK